MCGLGERLGHEAGKGRVRSTRAACHQLHVPAQDNEGILSENEPSADHVMLLDENENFKVNYQNFQCTVG